VNILLVRTGGLGDSILTLPVGFLLKKLYPKADLHILGNAAMLEAAGLTGDYAGFRSIEEAGFSSLFSEGEPTEFINNYFSKFEQVYFFSSGNEDRVKRIMAGSGVKICRVLDPRIPNEFNNHISSHFLSILDMDPGCSACLPPLSFESSSQRDKQKLVIHPGSGGISKIWPLERFLEIADYWTDPKKVAFLLGPAEIERGLYDRIPSRFEKVIAETVRIACEVLCSASFYLGNDSGISHLATLSGTRSLVLFGPSDPLVWRPLGPQVTILASACRSMEEIEIEDVIKALGNMRKHLT
jgi:heptosyltransferase III